MSGKEVEHYTLEVAEEEDAEEFLLSDLGEFSLRLPAFKVFLYIQMKFAPGLSLCSASLALLFKR